MLDKVKQFFGLNTVEGQVERALTIEKSIQENKAIALELSEQFSPQIVNLEKAIQTRELFDQLSSDELAKVDNLAMLGRFKDKLALLKSEYYTGIGELRKSNESFNSKLSHLTAKKEVNDGIALFKYKTALEGKFNHVFSEFEKGNVSSEILAKSFVSFKSKIGEKIEVNIDSLQKALENGLISLDLFEKAKKTYQERKVSKVMDEFKAGTLKDSAGKIVTDKEQAFAIAASEAGLAKSDEESESREEEVKKKLNKAFEDGLISEELFEKAKYIKRTGSAGNYKYEYEEEKGSSGKIREEKVEEKENISVSFKGDDLGKEYKDSLVKLANDYVKKLGIKEDITFNFKIIKGNMGGGVILSENPKKITEIQISNNQPNHGKLILHELTHVKQINNGELLLKDGNIIFKNEIFLSVKDYNKKFKGKWNDKKINEYKNLPWEKEAFEAEKQMDIQNKDGFIEIESNDTPDKVEKSINSFSNIKKAFENNEISEELFLKAEQSYIEKGRTGTYGDNATNRRLKRVGQTYGSKGQQEDPKGKKTAKKEEPKGEKNQSIEEQAKTSSGSALETASKESKDPEIRAAAHKELDRREKEEKVQEEEKTGEGEKVEEKTAEKDKKEPEAKENEFVEMFSKISTPMIENSYLMASNEEVRQAAEIILKERGVDFINKEDTDIINGFLKESNISIAALSKAVGGISDYETIKNTYDILGGKENIGKISRLEIKQVVSATRQGISVKMESENVEYMSRFYDPKNKIVTNNSFSLKKGSQAKGLGTNIFNSQVDKYKENGYKTIKTRAAKSDEQGEEYNGYYTWARLGYDMGKNNVTEFSNLVAESKNKDIKGAKSVSELMSFPEGRKFWKENGFEFDGEFDLSKGSKSSFMLEKYMEEKKNAKK